MTANDNYTNSGSFIRKLRSGMSSLYAPEQTEEMPVDDVEGELTPDFSNPFEANIRPEYVNQGAPMAATAPVKGAAPAKKAAPKKKAATKAAAPTKPAGTPPRTGPVTAPTTVPTTEQSALIIPVYKNSTTVKDSTGTTEKVSASQAQTQELYNRMMSEMDEKETRYGNVNEQFGTPEDRLRKQQTLGTTAKSDLANKLFDYTKQLDRNQEAEFWSKIIGGLGRMAAGGVGLATGLDVGGQYKEPVGVTAEELNKSATAKYAGEKANVEGSLKTDTDLLSAVDKYQNGLDMTMKEYTAFLREAQKDPSFKQKIEQKSTETTNEVRDEVLNIPKNRAEKSKDPSQQKKPFLKKIPYFAAIRATNQNFGNFEPSIQGRDGAEFGRAFKTALQSWAGGGAGFSVPDADKIGQQYEMLMRVRGMTPEQARQTILTDFQNVMQVQPAEGDTWEELNSRALMYGLPYGLLEPAFGADPQAALGVPATGATSVGNPNAVSEQSKGQKSFQIVPAKDGKAQSIDMFVDGVKVKNVPYSDAVVQELKKTGGRLIEAVKK
jgi:hypothetical protein